jgi:hypothetical protein
VKVLVINKKMRKVVSKTKQIITAVSFLTVPKEVKKSSPVTGLNRPRGWIEV